MANCQNFQLNIFCNSGPNSIENRYPKNYGQSDVNNEGEGKSIHPMTFGKMTNMTHPTLDIAVEACLHL